MNAWMDRWAIGVGRETEGDPFMFYGSFSHFLIDSGWGMGMRGDGMKIDGTWRLERQ
jgi:hypothetical protein